MQDIIMPQFGETIYEEVVITKWHKKVGDKVNCGEMLMTIATGKSVLDVESVYSGTLEEIIVDENESTQPLQVVGKIKV